MPLLLIALAIFVKFYGQLFVSPSVVITFPGEEGKEIPLDTVIEIQFDRSMNTRSVEKSFSLNPSTEGTFSWQGDSRVIFKPSQPLERSQAYSIKIGKWALSSYFIPKLRVDEISFETLGHPFVLLASPQTEAPEEKTPITVMFDRAMIPLTTAEEKEKKLPAFSVEPAMEGEGRWLGSTAYQFRPLNPYKAATTYTFKVDKGLKSEDGGEIQKALIYTFSTQRPRVESVLPKRDYLYSDPRGEMSATLNLPIDLESAINSFHLYLLKDGKRAEISTVVTVEEDEIRIQPLQPLVRGARYEAVIDEGLKSTEGENGLETHYSWQFSVAPLPKIINSTPADGDVDVAEKHRISVEFISPMDQDSFEDNVTISPAPDRDPSLSFSSYGNSNRLGIGTFLARSTKYTVNISGNVFDQYGVPLGESYSFSFTTSAYQPSISIVPSGTYFASFNQGVVPRIVSKVVNVNKVSYKLFKLKRKDFFDLYSKAYVNPNYRDGIWQKYDTSKLNLVREWTEEFDAARNVPVHVITKVNASSGNKLASGLYFLDASIGGGNHDNIVMVVSQSTLALKTSPNQALVWAVDQGTAEPIADMEVELVSLGGTEKARGKTNKDGVLISETFIRSERSSYISRREPLFAFASKDEDAAVVIDIWEDGIEPYDFGLERYYDSQEIDDYKSEEQLKIHVLLDRPIYRPGQKVYYKGVVRKDDDGQFQLLDQSSQIKIVVKAPRNQEVYVESVPLTSYGTFSGSFDISEDGAVGNYSIRATILGNGFSQRFQVEEYRRPDFSVEVTTDNLDYINRELVAAQVDANFFFGAPLDDAPVTWTLVTQDQPYRWSRDRRFEFGDSDSYWYSPWWTFKQSGFYSGEKVTEGEGKTDSKGNFKIKIPVNISDKSSDQRMRLEAEIEDQSNRVIANSTEFVVHKAGLHVGLKPERYSSRAGEESRVEVITVGIDDKEIPDRQVKISFYKRTWNSIREKNPDDGRFYWVSKPSDQFISSQEIVTGQFGRGTAIFTPSDGGSFRVVAEATDANGNVTITSSSLWVSGFGRSVRRENHDRIMLVPNKQEYSLGETARIFANVPFESSTGLITVERGSVFDYQIVKTNQDNQTASIPIKDKYAPNVFVSGLFVKPGQEVKDPAEFRMGIAEIRVDNPSRKINISLEPNKEKYSPGETMNVKLKTLDGNQKPVQSEVAVVLVDEAVWSLARVNLADIFETFYRPRNLTVHTSTDLTKSMDRINANVNLGSKGGSGGGGALESGLLTDRENFLDTALWKAHLETNNNGEASLSIDLPDNTTTWRLIAVAVTRDTAVGDNLREVLVTKDVVIQPLLPRFLSVGDEPTLGMTVHNNTDSNQTFKTKIEATGITISDDLNQTFQIPAKSSKSIYWNGIVEAVSESTIRLVAESPGGIADSIKKNLPVVSYFTPETVATSGQASDVGQEKVFLPHDIVPNQGELAISLSPSLGSDVQAASDYLLSFPYWCSEQTISRVMPSAHLLELAKQAELTSVGGRSLESLESLISDGVQRLINTQHTDGGWGWWSTFETDPYLTALVMRGLLDAKERGHTVSDTVLSKGISYLNRHLAMSDEVLDVQAFIASVAATGGKVNSAVFSRLMDKRWEMKPLGRAHLLRALQLGGGSSRDQKRLLDELLSLADKTNTTAHWESGNSHWSMMSGSVTLTSVMLQALVHSNNNHPLIPDVTRWLMQTRKDGHWKTTRETGEAIRAIVSMLLSRGETKLDESWLIDIDGKRIAEGSFETQDFLKEVEEIIELAGIPKGKDVSVDIKKSGKGSLYYNMNLKYFLPFTEVEPLDQGIVIIRELVDREGNKLEDGKVTSDGELWTRLTLLFPAERHHVIVEDILPAGLEPVNESLATTSLLNVERLKIPDGRKQLYFRHQEMRDDRVVLFAERVPAGVYEYTYRVRPTTLGKYHHPPAQVYNMYVPDISGHSSGGWLEVVEGENE